MKVEAHLQIPNTLALQAQAELGCQAFSISDVVQAREFAREQKLAFVPVGEGSNIVPHARVDSFVCVLKTRGIELVDEDAAQVRVRVAAGENWHQFVLHCLQQSWFGLENLALIPGSVGAAPVQNIGAYGVEVSSFIESLEVLDDRSKLSSLRASDCHFSYRDSLFKQVPGHTIVSVTLRLAKRAAPVIDYPELKAELRGETAVTAQQVADAVIAIRQRKLPTPAQYPNVGSFFKNPVVDRTLADELSGRIDDLQMYALPTAGTASVKLSAAQLIDRAGWKNKAAQRVACWQKQPLVLVNTGGASDVEVLEFAAAIAEDIQSRFGVQLELEPSELS